VESDIGHPDLRTGSAVAHMAKRIPNVEATLCPASVLKRSGTR
jgi:hypothetical protein